MKTILLASLLLTSFQLLMAQDSSVLLQNDDSKATIQAKTVNDCFKNAARKVIDNCSYEMRYSYIDDIDIIVYRLSDYEAIVSMQWVLIKGNQPEIYWISGKVKMEDLDEDCSYARIKVIDNSRNLTRTNIIRDIGCTRKFIQKSMGAGRPFGKAKKKSQLKN